MGEERKGRGGGVADRCRDGIGPEVVHVVDWMPVVGGWWCRICKVITAVTVGFDLAWRYLCSVFNCIGRNGMA